MCTPPQIVYLDAFKLVQGSRELQNDHVMSCVNWLRAQPIYRNSLLVYIPENAPGSRGSELAYVLDHVENSVVMREFGQDKRPGVPKTPDITVNMVMRMRRLLNNDALHLAAPLGTYGGGETVEATATAAKVEQLCSQLLAFERVKPTPDSATGKWSGKHGVSGRDDLAVATLMIPYWSEVFYRSADYASVLGAAHHRLQMARLARG